MKNRSFLRRRRPEHNYNAKDNILMKKFRHRPIKKYTVYILLTILIALIAATILSWRFYLRTLETGEWDDAHSAARYSRHYVMIADDSASSLWQSIYRSASEAAKRQDACLELLGGWSGDSYTLTDYVNIAVASKADGIILKPDGTARLRAAINEAEENGIPVITVLEDEADSGRKSFVGLNSYQTGITYGSQILGCIRDDTKKVTVLLRRGDTGKDIVFQQLKATVQEGLGPGHEISVVSHTITEGGSFDAEEAIRELFHDEDTRPDILVCMNETDSKCAYYAMVDYNQVGSVQLIGYYQSDMMVSAVQKGVIPMVVTLDAQQVGECCIEALDEYYEMGHVSSYFSVGLNIITAQNAADYLQEGGEDE